MDFVLVYPPSSERSAEFPVGGLFLADALQKRGYSCSIICDKPLNEIFKELDNCVNGETVAIGLSVVSTLIFKDSLSIARHIKDKFPSIPLVFGGQAVTAQKEQMLEFDPVDYVVVGDGEEALPDLMDSLSKNTDYKSIVGLGYKLKGELFFNDIATYDDFGKVFDLPYHLLDVDHYFRNLNIGGDRWLGAIYSRGCPYRCTFCIISAYGSNIGTMRYHTLDHVMNDLRVLSEEYGADAISIHDDHFLIDQSRVVEFCEMVIQSGIKIDFRANGRIDSISRMEEKTLKILRKAGFVNLIAGIETGSPRYLEVMRKNLSLDQIAVADRKLTEYGFYKHWNFMSAMPGETMEDVGHTIWLIAQLAKTCMTSAYPMSYRKYIPLPGTEMYRQAVEEYGFEEPRNLEDWSDISEAYMNERSFGDTLGNAGKLALRKRPWLNSELGRYIQRAEDAVVEMNELFVGENSDRELIIKKIEIVQKIALETVRGKTEYPEIDYNEKILIRSLSDSSEFKQKSSPLQRTHSPTYSTYEEAEISARKVVRFKSGKHFKQAVNDEDGI